MPPFQSRWTNQQLEQWISRLLLAGVVISASVILLGGARSTYRAHAGELADHHDFHAQPESLRSIPEIVAGAVQLQGPDVIQFGLLLLIFTPVARVALTVVAFAVQRDFAYVGITATVLAILLFSLFGARLLSGQ